MTIKKQEVHEIRGRLDDLICLLSPWKRECPHSTVFSGKSLLFFFCPRSQIETGGSGLEKDLRKNMEEC